MSVLPKVVILTIALACVLGKPHSDLPFYCSVLDVETRCPTYEPVRGCQEYSVEIENCCRKTVCKKRGEPIRPVRPYVEDIPSYCSEEDKFSCPIYEPVRGCEEYSVEIEGCCRKTVCKKRGGPIRPVRPYVEDIPSYCSEEDKFSCPIYDPVRGCEEYSVEIEGCCRKTVCKKRGGPIRPVRPYVEDIPSYCSEEDKFRCPIYEPVRGCAEYSVEIEGCCRKTVCKKRGEPIRPVRPYNPYFW